MLLKYTYFKTTMNTIKPTQEIINYYKSFNIDIGLFKQCYDLVKNSPFSMKSSEVTYDNYLDSLIRAYVFSLTINLPAIRAVLRYDSVKHGYDNIRKGIPRLWYENGIIIYHQLTMKQLEQFVRIKRVMRNFQIVETLNIFLNASETKLPLDKQKQLLLKHSEKASRLNAICKPWNLFYVAVSDEGRSTRFYITQADCNTCCGLVSKDLSQYVIKDAVLDVSNNPDHKHKFDDTESKINPAEIKYFKSLRYFDDGMREFNAMMKNTGLEHIHDGDNAPAPDEIIRLYKERLKNSTKESLIPADHKSIKFHEVKNNTCDNADVDVIIKNKKKHKQKHHKKNKNRNRNRNRKIVKKS